MRGRGMDFEGDSVKASRADARGISIQVGRLNRYKMGGWRIHIAEYKKWMFSEETDQNLMVIIIPIFTSRIIN